MQHYEYMLEMIAGGKTAAQVRCAAIDWIPAMEYGRFEALRRAHTPPTTSCPPVGIEPVWDRLGGPRVTGLRPVVWPDQPQRWSPEAPVPLTYFRAAAKTAATQCVAAGQLKEGQTYSFRVLAFAAQSAAPALPAADAFAVEAVEQPLVPRPAALATFASQCPEMAALHGAAAHLPVFLPHHVLDETRALCRRNPEVETGGLLIGHLCRDTADASRLFVEVTGQIPAAHADSDAMRLTFTPQTWAAARTALQLRRSSEMILGWWHDHPFWCRKCTPDKRAACPLARTFFSTTDCALHRSVFDKAFHVALLLTDGDAGLVQAMFGWRRGLIEAIPFGILGASPSDRNQPAALAAIVGGDERA